MTKIEIEMDAATQARVNWLIKLYKCTPQELFKEAIKQLATANAEQYPLVGGWQNEAELVDEMLADIMKDRGRNNLNIYKENIDY